MDEKGQLEEVTTGAKWLKWVDYIINGIFNQWLICISLIGAIIWIQTIQLMEIYKDPYNLEYLQVYDYIKDTVSNVINLIFLLRFSSVEFYSVPLEVALLIIQIVFMVVNIRTNVVLEFNFSVVLLGLQHMCPMLINIVNLVDYLQDAISFKRLLLECNNNLLPIMLTNSFRFINLNFRLFSDANGLLAYKVLIIMLKFYCLYQYILFELYRTFAKESLLGKNPEFSRHNTFAVCILVLLGFDMWLIYVLGFIY